MTIRTRKFIGMFANVAWLVVYALLAMVLGAKYVIGNGFAAEISYYVVMGFAWLPVSMILIRWMSRPDPEP